MTNPAKFETLETPCLLLKSHFFEALETHLYPISSHYMNWFSWLNGNMSGTCWVDSQLDPQFMPIYIP